MKHWVKYLKETGQIIGRGNEQEYIANEIEQAIDRAIGLKNILLRNEDEITKIALKDWTKKEIKKAKKDSKKASQLKH